MKSAALTRLLAISLAVLTLPPPMVAQEPTTVTLTSQNLAVGETQTLEALIDCQVDACTAFALTIRYDPTILQVDTVRVGPYLGDQVFVVQNRIDATNGTVQLDAAALGEAETASDPTLLYLDVVALKPGMSRLDITDLRIADEAGLRLEAIGIAGEITVYATPAEIPSRTPTLGVAVVPTVPLTSSGAASPTLDIVQVVETLAVQATAAAQATSIVGTMTQAVLDAEATQTQSAGQTALALLRTDTPTPNITASIETYLTGAAHWTQTQRADDLTATATRWTRTPTVTPTIRPTNTRQPTSTATSAPPRTYYVQANANARQCPRLNCSIVTTFAANATVSVVGYETGERFSGSVNWYRVMDRGRVVYVHSSLLALQPPPTARPTLRPTAAPRSSANIHIGSRSGGVCQGDPQLFSGQPILLSRVYCQEQWKSSADVQASFPGITPAFSIDGGAPIYGRFGDTFCCNGDGWTCTVTEANWVAIPGSHTLTSYLGPSTDLAWSCTFTVR